MLGYSDWEQQAHAELKWKYRQSSSGNYIHPIICCMAVFSFNNAVSLI